MKKLVKKILKWGIVLSVLITLLIIISNLWVIQFSKQYLYDDVSTIPTHDVGVVLGTSKSGKYGNVNYYFKYRIDAAAKLYKEGKIKHIIVSGDNRKKNYNEPQQMKEDLIKKGVPEENITLDYAGFRTFDSMLRTFQVFGIKKFIVISQQFHNERAVFIARKKGLEAIAYNAKTIKMSFRLRSREYLAKTKAVLDIYILNTKAKFDGPKEPLYIN